MAAVDVRRDRAPMTPSTLLCAVADDDRTGDVLATAAQLADRGGFRPLYVHVAPIAVPPSHAHGYGYRGGPRAEALVLKTMDELCADALNRGARLLAGLRVPDDEALVVAGTPPRSCCASRASATPRCSSPGRVGGDALAADRDAQLLVVGSRGHGALRAALERSRVARAGAQRVPTGRRRAAGLATGERALRPRAAAGPAVGDPRAADEARAPTGVAASVLP